MLRCSLLLVVVSLVWVNGCGRTEMEAGGRGAGGAGGSIAAGGGGSDASTGGAGGAVSGPCAEARCLTSLFRTCVPEGSCTIQGGSSPSASYNTTCYSNGISVSYVGSYNGTSTTRTLVVRRNRALCYSIESSTPANYSNGTTYVVRDADGKEVATGLLTDKSGTVLVTCNAGQPTRVGGACLRPEGDSSGCESGTCP